MTYATNNDALNEFARNVGRECPHPAWLLHDSDTWVTNPFYTGEPVPHPESDEDEGEEDIDCDDSDDGYALASAGFGTDEDYGMYDSGDY